MRAVFVVILLILVLQSCTTDFPQKTINTDHLEGYIKGGRATGIYDQAGLRIDIDSINMVDWPFSRLTGHLNTILDTSLVDQTKSSEFYTIQIANKGNLSQIEFCDSLVVVFTRHGLLR
ncbi:MAG: hypothetical protein WBA16_04650 [Nonlabens sp.]